MAGASWTGEMAMGAMGAPTLTVQVNARVPVLGLVPVALSVAWTVKLKIPASEGAPLRTPSYVSVTPAGSRLPGARAKL
jgi:hypothetical protein